MRKFSSVRHYKIDIVATPLTTEHARSRQTTNVVWIKHNALLRMNVYALSEYIFVSPYINNETTISRYKLHLIACNSHCVFNFFPFYTIFPVWQLLKAGQ